MTMSATLTPESAVVPLPDNQDVVIEPGQPWPSAYRGSKYSIVHSRRHDTPVLRWQYNDLMAQIEPPNGLLETLRTLGKSRDSGKGSIRITAGGEVLTKIHSDNYAHVNQAPVGSGWIPVYLGKLDQRLGFDIENDPRPDNTEVDVWSGFPFNHGERWAVSNDGRLVWKWKDYRFYSAFDHSELVDQYLKYRRIAGRLYVNESGHVFGNVPRGELPSDREDEIARLYANWQQERKQQDDTAALHLVTRRLKVTGDGDPQQGHLPLHLGHLNQFDDGSLPRPVVDDESYYVAAARGETLKSY